MIINVTDIIKNEGQRKYFSFTKPAQNNTFEFFGENVRLLRPISAIGNVVNYDKKIHLDMNIKTKISRICSRCLISYEEEIDIDANYVFIRDSQGDDEDLIVFTGDLIDITSIVFDEITSQMSMKPLCKIDCKGLCSICGNNKNLKDCECFIENIDIRLEVLKSLLEKE